MNISFVVVGKTNVDFVEQSVEVYRKRILNYNKFEIVVVPDIKNSKNLNPEQLKEQEGRVLEELLSKYDYIVLLDENGKEFTSVGFSQWIEKLNFRSLRSVCFVVGGAYGFAQSIYNMSDSKISLSKMTFSHQMIRMLFCEQLYRAFTILKGEPYHHK